MRCRSVRTVPSVGTARIPGALDDAVAPQPLDLLGPVAGFLQDLVGVLAQQRGLAIDPGAAVLEAEAGVDELQLG